MEIEELVEAAVWNEKLRNVINNISGFKFTVRKRLKKNISEDDLLTLKNYKNYLLKKKGEEEEREKEEKKEVDPERGLKIAEAKKSLQLKN